MQANVLYVGFIKGPQAGSFGDRIKRWAQMASEGTLPADQVQQILGVVKDNYEAKRKAGAEAYGYGFPNRPLPPWLRGEVPENAEPKQGTPPPGAKVRDYSDLH